MHYSYEDVETFIKEENVKFIRLAFFDVFGVQKNISILPQELKRAFSEGISFDASAIAGFGDTAKSDLFLKPDPSTLVVLPWRPMDGRVVRMYCDIMYPDGTQFEKDCRLILKQEPKASTSILAPRSNFTCFSKTSTACPPISPSTAPVIWM